MATKQVIVVRRDLQMRAGKIGAQVAHASGGAIKSLQRSHMSVLQDTKIYTLTVSVNTPLWDWYEGQWTKTVLGTTKTLADADEHLKELLTFKAQAEAAGLPVCLVTDSGKTEFNGVPTVTCLAIGPGEVEEINKITGHLKPL